MAKKTQSESERSGVEHWAKDGSQKLLQARTLVDCPILLDFLKPDMKVLDMGCGPGTITLDVARKVGRGSVTGIDPNEEGLKNARTAAEESGLRNVEFRVGDSYSLEFPDGNFDLVYSNQLFQYLKKPIDALKEQARVTRAGGWVVVMTSCWEFYLLYPECPEFSRLLKTFRALKKAPKEVEFFNTFSPFEVVEFFVGAGFQNYKINSFTPRTDVAYTDSKYFEYRYHFFQMLLEVSKEKEAYHLERGLISRDTIDKAKAEIENWYIHPHALLIQPCVAACGHVD